MIFVISGPGGIGKGTIVSRLVERDPTLWLSRSWTTRARRPGESDDAYVFTTRDEFEKRVEAGGFLEWVEFLDYLQGSPLPEPPAGSDVMFEIDVYGARQILQRYPDAICVFIDAPSREEQRRRMLGRGDAPERIEKRLAKSEDEVAVADALGCTRFVNDDLDATVAQLEGFIAERRSVQLREAER